MDLRVIADDQGHKEEILAVLGENFEGFAIQPTANPLEFKVSGLPTDAMSLVEGLLREISVNRKVAPDTC